MNRLTDECILALDAGGTSIKLALVVTDGGQGILGFSEIPINSSGSIEEIKQGYRSAIFAGLQLAQSHGLTIKGIGISTPGPFDYQNGISLMTHKYPALYGKSIREIIEQEVQHIPVRFMHDSNAFLIGEIQLPCYSSCKTPCVVMLGTGLGFALMHGRTLSVNSSGGPGVSIFRRPYRGEIAEEFLSKRGIMRIYQELGGVGFKTVKELDSQAHKGNALCQQVFAVTGWHAAHILAPIIIEHAIDCLILGGQIAKADELLVEPIKATLKELSIDCLVFKAQTIDAAPLVGVAQLF